MMLLRENTAYINKTRVTYKSFYNLTAIFYQFNYLDQDNNNRYTEYMLWIIIMHMQMYCMSG